MAMTMSEIKALANDFCKRGATLEQIENLRTYYIDAQKKEQEEKRKAADAAARKSQAACISANYEHGKTTLTDFSDIFYAALRNYAPELPQDIIVHMTCIDSCKDLFEQIIVAYMQAKESTTTSEFDALVNKLNKLL